MFFGFWYKITFEQTKGSDLLKISNQFSFQLWKEFTLGYVYSK